MIGNLSSKIVEKLIGLSIISDTEQELYVYGFFVLLSHILFLAITVIFGILLDIVLASVIFYIAFQFIRRYAGGIHASSELKCELATTLSIFLCLLCIKVCMQYNAELLILFPTLAASFLVFFLCPLDTPEKPLTQKEKSHFRKVSRIVLFLILLVIAVSFCLKFKILMYPCSLSLILESILLVFGKIKGVLIKKGQNEYV